MSSPQHTQLTDIVTHPLFAQYVDEAVAQHSQLVMSGIVQDDVLGYDVPPNTRTVDVPFWPDLDASDDEVVSTAGEALTSAKVQASKDQATTILRSKEWSWSQFTSMYGQGIGGDPADYLARKLGDWQVKRELAILLAILTGVFTRNAAKTPGVDVGTSGDLIFDITGANGNAAFLQRSTLVWAKQKLGTARGTLTGIICPSIFATELKTLDPLNYQDQKTDERGFVTELAKYDGLNIIEDDSLPYDPSTGIVTAYLFGRGAIARQRLSVEHAIEQYRNPNRSLEFLIRRFRMLLHPRGYAWIGTASAETPSNSELATATNWKQVYETKNCRFIKMACKLRGAAFEPSIHVTVDGTVKTSEVGDEESDSGSASASGSQP